MKVSEFIPLLVVRFTGTPWFACSLGTALRMNESARLVCALARQPAAE